MPNKQEKVIDIDELIALCHIIDDYPQFDENLKRALNYNLNLSRSTTIADKLWRVSIEKIGEKVPFARKERKFYAENKKTIDTINKYSYFSNFIFNNYVDDYEKEYYDEEEYSIRKNKNTLEYFYNYIKNNKNKLDDIILLLNKIKELGFTKIKFNSNLDFTEEEYILYDELDKNRQISYLDNMEAIPTYNNSMIKYRTTGSNYKIVSNCWYDIYSDKDYKDITLNSLTFDPERLPKGKDKKYLYDKIIELRDEKKESYDTIRNSIDLNKSISNLNVEFDKIKNIIEVLNNTKSKEEMHRILVTIKPYLEQLQIKNTEYEQSILKQDRNITREILQEEKKLNIKRK